MHSADGPKEHAAAFDEDYERDIDDADISEMLADESRDDLIDVRREAPYSGWAVRSSPLVAAFILALLSGCATCQRHPAGCAIAAAIVVGSIAAYGAHDNDRTNAPRYAPLCAPYCIVQ